MAILILGLVLFLGMHSTRILYPAGRDRFVRRYGETAWKGLYAVVSAVGLVVLVWGFAQARTEPVVLYAPPLWLRHLNALFTLLAFVLLAAAYVPRNHFRQKVGHPMLAGVKVWAFGHLLATGMLHDVVLFGAFLIWAIADFAASRRRDRRRGVARPVGTATGDVVTVVVGVAAWALFAFVLHTWWIGVSPWA